MFDFGEELLRCCDTIDINRDNFKYRNQYGVLVPRVTDIISTMIHSDSIVHWANSLGFRHLKYEDELNKAANIGTETHTLIESFFNDDKDNYQNKKSIPFDGFIQWYLNISKNNIVNCIFTEKALICDYYGGTCDALIKINELKYLVDWKTSNYITYKYALQLAAYRYMLFQLYNIEVDGLIILQFNKKEVGYNEYVFDIKNNQQHAEFIDFCTETFHFLVNGYYRIKYCENQFKNIFKNGGNIL